VREAAEGDEFADRELHLHVVGLRENGKVLRELPAFPFLEVLALKLNGARTFCSGKF
jgi:hypothetical protein